MAGVIMTAGEYGWLRRFEMTIQGWEWIIILVIVLLVFGVGRLGFAVGFRGPAWRGVGGRFVAPWFVFCVNRAAP